MNNIKAIRKRAKKILFDKLKHQGLEYTLFPNGDINDSNSIIETIIDGMMLFNTNEDIINNLPV